MITTLLYSMTGLLLFAMGFFTLIVHSHPLRKILAVNVMSTGVFLILVATAYKPLGMGQIDPVPHAMVLTGIVVSVSVTALALLLACRVQETSNLDLPGRKKQGRIPEESGQ
ncbi:MAG: cation:proton antiporter subunit C [Proteobacteria bacterium]|nr:cation:proton antiporter subunit C [Pseudomonadota bacterium]MBU1234079.1 cation:proton antiporter subunit C [Pseudomonadota bacterium]MBU1418093.1 cation:proton antiporter subunit C [Pseudomonadota bacterium]MBU1456476.1 cation:proton antiporter subunit C [Pseudomonadota bacterium]